MHSLTDSRRRELGTALIWIGVLAWIPYFFLLENDRAPSLLLFLALHLAGVLGGSWLRSSAHRDAEHQVATRGRWRQPVSRVLIYLGVMAWGPYFYLERILHQEVAIDPFLAAHLTGVLGGAALRVSIELDRIKTRGS